jgi:hypothetical protein
MRPQIDVRFRTGICRFILMPIMLEPAAMALPILLGAAVPAPIDHSGRMLL